MNGSERNPANRAAAPFWLKFVSLLSGGSLLLFGLASVLLSTVFWSWPGLLVGLAMAVHGGLELRFRQRLISGRERRAAKILAINQLALGLTLTLYLATQIVGLEGAAVEEALRGDLIQSLLQGLPASAQESLEADLRMLTKVLGYALWRRFGLAAWRWRITTATTAGHCRLWRCRVGLEASPCGRAPERASGAAPAACPD